MSHNRTPPLPNGGWDRLQRPSNPEWGVENVQMDGVWVETFYVGEISKNGNILSK